MSTDLMGWILALLIAIAWVVTMVVASQSQERTERRLREELARRAGLLAHLHESLISAGMKGLTGHLDTLFPTDADLFIRQLKAKAQHKRVPKA